MIYYFPVRLLFCVVIILVFPAVCLAEESNGSSFHLINSIGISIIAATILAYIAHRFKQPLLLAYIAAGVLIGPVVGLGLVSSEKEIETITEIGLVLLLFMIGLEINVKKLMEAGKSLIAVGIMQFLLCVILGIGFFALIGYSMGNGRFDLLYIAVACAMSSTTIVVKLLYEKFELDTLAGRITLGVLVFQDIWAIVVLGVQPNLSHPAVFEILGSFIKGGLLVAFSFTVSRYFLGSIFRSLAKVPELILVASLGWCFSICGLADILGLSREMGALIAGVAISTFPYNHDVIAKIINIRDFFITLFFVALGMKIPNPFNDIHLLFLAIAGSLFLIASRFLSVFPILYKFQNGNRVSLLVPINLAQMSEFALVIAAMGYGLGHIGIDTLSLIIYIFVITSVVSTYMIKFSHPLQHRINQLIQRIGIRELGNDRDKDDEDEGKDIVLLGFYRVASSLVGEIMINKEDGAILRDKMLVVDFNPEVHQKLNAMGIQAVYGDIGNMDTLHHAGLESARLIVSTIPDHILRGTDNMKLLQVSKKIAPHARVVVTAEGPKQAIQLYEAGADYVLLGCHLEAASLFDVLREIMRDTPLFDPETEIANLKSRQEILH